MRKHLCLFAWLLLWATCLCHAQERTAVRFEHMNGVQFSRQITDNNRSNCLDVGFTMAPGVCFADRFVLSVPAKMNLYTSLLPEPKVSHDIMVGLSAAYRPGSVDVEASHLFGIWYSDVGLMESGISLLFNRGKNDRSSFYKIGVSYLTPYQKEGKGNLCVSAGLGLRLFSTKRTK